MAADRELRPSLTKMWLILLAEVRDGRIADLTIYCSGDWNAELRARDAAETRLLRS